MDTSNARSKYGYQWLEDIRELVEGQVVDPRLRRCNVERPG